MTNPGFEHRLYGWKEEQEEKKDESKYLTRSAQSLLDRCTESTKKQERKTVTVEVMLAVLACQGPWSDLQPSYLLNHIEWPTENCHDIRIGVHDAAEWKDRLKPKVATPRGLATSLKQGIKKAHEIRRTMKEKWTSVDHIMLAFLNHTSSDYFEQILKGSGLQRERLIARITQDRVSKILGRSWDIKGACRNLAQGE